MTIRNAQPQDAVDLARLMNIAGEGLPFYLWRQDAPGADPLSCGIERVQRESGAFSYRNARVLEREGHIAGMLLGYPLDDPFEPGDISRFPALVVPLVELEAEAAGSWYINAVATYPELRGCGVASALMRDAEYRAREAGCHTLALIVAEQNRNAADLYRKLGYLPRASRAVVPYPGATQGGRWLLMIKPLASQG